MLPDRIGLNSCRKRVVQLKYDIEVIEDRIRFPDED